MAGSRSAEVPPLRCLRRAPRSSTLRLNSLVPALLPPARIAHFKRPPLDVGRPPRSALVTFDRHSSAPPRPRPVSNSDRTPLRPSGSLRTPWSPTPPSGPWSRAERLSVAWRASSFTTSACVALPCSSGHLGLFAARECGLSPAPVQGGPRAPVCPRTVVIGRAAWRGGCRPRGGRRTSVRRERIR
jgi:hypothetical protein